MTKKTAPVGVVGSHEPDYPRHLVLEDALRVSGREVFVRCSRIGFPWRHFAIARHVFALPKSVRVIYATEGAHRLVPLMKVWAWITGRKILFDPFLSRYNTRVEDRKLYEPGSLQAKIAYWQDWSSCKAADFLIFDTHEHRDYFFAKYALSAPSEVVPVGVPEALFVYPPSEASTASSQFEVLFYGTYIPLQGIETIVRAAQCLPPGIRITIIGKGQTYDEIMLLVDSLSIDPERLRFEEPVPFDQLPKRLSKADIALGIFGTTAKAQRVVPNKVVQAAAMGCAIVTADTPAIRRYFEDGHNILLVPPGDHAALAKGLLTLRDNPAMCARLGEAARFVFEAHFSQQAIATKMSSAVAHLEGNSFQGGTIKR